MSAHSSQQFDKNFLKQNDLAAAVSPVLSFLQENLKLVIALLVVLMLAAGGLLYWKHEQKKDVHRFNDALLRADKSIKKEEAYREVLSEYGNVAASDLVRLRLASVLIETQKPDEALKVLQEGLSKEHNDVLETLLVLKSLDILKSQNKFDEAARFAQEHANNVLKPYAHQLKLMQADLLLLAGKKDEARTVYDSLSRLKPKTEGKPQEDPEYDATVVSQAKEKLMLLEMGVL